MSIGAGLSHLIPATHLLDRKQRKGSKLLISFPFFCPSAGSLLFAFSISLSFALEDQESWSSPWPYIFLNPSGWWSKADRHSSETGVNQTLLAGALWRKGTYLSTTKRSRRQDHFFSCPHMLNMRSGHARDPSLDARESGHCVGALAWSVSLPACALQGLSRCFWPLSLGLGSRLEPQWPSFQGLPLEGHHTSKPGFQSWLGRRKAVLEEIYLPWAFRQKGWPSNCTCFIGKHVM